MKSAPAKAVARLICRSRSRSASSSRPSAAFSASARVCQTLAAAGQCHIQAIRGIISRLEAELCIRRSAAPDHDHRVWLRYELFRGTLSRDAFEASELDLADFMKARGGRTPK